MFCTANWELLSLNETDPLRADGLVAIFRSSMGRKNPNSFRTLATLLAIAGLTDIFRLTPLGILSNGERRQCQSGRAEAIMSVIGVTEWYEESYDIKSHVPAMMLGRFPAKFVIEVRLKIGAPFFLTNWHDGGQAYSRFADCALNAQSLDPIGSMLPFGRQLLSEAHAVPMVFNSCQEGHESVKTWILSSNGMVHIGDAAIIASCTAAAFPQNSKLNTRLYFEDAVDNYSVALLDLQSWMNSQGFSSVAVVVTCDTRSYIRGLWRHIHGIILRCLRDSYYIKFATFSYKGWDDELPPIPAAENVNWVVL
jgi:hypothetical protein